MINIWSVTHPKVKEALKTLPDDIFLQIMFNLHSSGFDIEDLLKQFNENISKNKNEQRT